jgi:hypothetical protein
MGKRFFLVATLASLLVSVGCLERMCERHGYYRAAPAPAYPPQCCVPCVPCQPGPAAGYVAPSSSWNAPVAAAGTCPPGCVPANHP